jgi:membrane protein
MINIHQLLAVYQRHIWNTDTEELPWWRALGVKAARLLYVLIRDLWDGRLILYACGLVYTTLLAIVPLLAVSFSVAKAFGVHNELEPLLYNFLKPLGPQGRELSVQIIESVDNMKVGLLGTVGLGFLFYITISLIQRVEEAFNYIWHVERSRSLSQQFGSYSSVIMTVPVLVFAALGMTASLTSTTIVRAIVSIEPFGSLYEIVSTLVPYLLVIAAFTFVYFFLPNTRVRLTAAFTGGVVAGVLWQTMGWIFAHFIATSASYAAIYSGFAILIILMIWIYWNWMILLVGASIAFYQQHAEYLVAGRREVQLSNCRREEIALMIMVLIGQHWYWQRAAWTADGLVKRLGMPFHTIQDVLQILERGGLLSRNIDNPPGWIPARPLETTAVKEVLDVVRRATRGPDLPPRHSPDTGAAEQIIEEIDHAVGNTLDGLTLKDLVMDDTRTDELVSRTPRVLSSRGQNTAL